LGLKASAHDLVCELNVLWAKPTKAEFDSCLGKFLTEWDKKKPQYSGYFRATWLEHHEPKDWASYARPSDARSGMITVSFVGNRSCLRFASGSAVSEGYNRRLDHIMPRNVLALDAMVDFLAGEDEYWRRIVNDPRSWGYKQTEAAAGRERHLKKRRKLSHYVDSRNTTVPRPSVSLTLSDLEDEDDDREDYVHKEPFAPPGLPEVADGGLVNDHNNNEAASGRKRPCSTCKRSKIINKDCSLMVCKECCSESTLYCQVTQHKRSKLGAAKPYMQTSLATQAAAPLERVLEMVNSAIKDKRDVYISYNGGTFGDGPRKITPKKVLVQGKDGRLVEALCHAKNATRHFYLHKITRIEHHDWSTDVSSASGNLEDLCYSLY
jgi:hypothetical protein